MKKIIENPVQIERSIVDLVNDYEGLANTRNLKANLLCIKGYYHEAVENFRKTIEFLKESNRLLKLEIKHNDTINRR